MKQNHLAEFLSFNMITDRLDEFYLNYMKDTKHSKVLEVFRIMFTFLCGQAAVERWFSVNNELLVEYLQEKTLDASCFVYSSVKSDANHFSELFFYPQTATKCLGSKNAHQLYLKEQRKLHAKSDKAKKMKAVEDEICEVKCERKLLNKSIQAMSLETDKLAAEAEVKHNFTLLAK